MEKKKTEKKDTFTLVFIILAVILFFGVSILESMNSIPEQSREYTVSCYDYMGHKIEDLTCTQKTTCSRLDQITKGCDAYFKSFEKTIWP